MSAITPRIVPMVHQSFAEEIFSTAPVSAVRVGKTLSSGFSQRSSSSSITSREASFERISAILLYASRRLLRCLLPVE